MPVEVHVFICVSKGQYVSITMFTCALFLRVPIYPFLIPPTVTCERVPWHLRSLSPNKDQITYIELEKESDKLHTMKS